MRTAAFCARVGMVAQGKGYLLYAGVVVERSSGANEEVCAVLVWIEGEYFLGPLLWPVDFRVYSSGPQ